MQLLYRFDLVAPIIQSYYFILTSLKNNIICWMLKAN